MLSLLRLCWAVLSHSVLSDSSLCNPMDCSPPGFSVHEDSPGKNIGVGCHAILQGIFPTQGLNPDLSHCRWILYHLSHQGSPVCLPPEGCRLHSLHVRWQIFIFSLLRFWLLQFPSMNREKAMASHSSTLAWTVPWTEEPGGLQSMGSLGVGHDWSNLACKKEG